MHGRYTEIGDNGITGILSAGEDGGHTYEFQARALPSQYVAVSISFGINNSTEFNSPDVDVVGDQKFLGDVE